MRCVCAVRRQRAGEWRQAHATGRRHQTAGLLGRIAAVGLDQLLDGHIFHTAVAVLARGPRLRKHETNG